MVGGAGRPFVGLKAYPCTVFFLMVLFSYVHWFSERVRPNARRVVEQVIIYLAFSSCYPLMYVSPFLELSVSWSVDRGLLLFAEHVRFHFVDIRHRMRISSECYEYFFRFPFFVFLCVIVKYIPRCGFGKYLVIAYEW